MIKSPLQMSFSLQHSLLLKVFIPLGSMSKTKRSLTNLHVLYRSITYDCNINLNKVSDSRFIEQTMTVATWRVAITCAGTLCRFPLYWYWRTLTELINPDGILKLCVLFRSYFCTDGSRIVRFLFRDNPIGFRAGRKKNPNPIVNLIFNPIATFLPLIFSY